MKIFYINLIKLKSLKAFNSTLQFGRGSTTAKNRAAPQTKLTRNDQQNRRQVSQLPVATETRSILILKN